MSDGEGMSYEELKVAIAQGTQKALALKEAGDKAGAKVEAKRVAKLKERKKGMGRRSSVMVEEVNLDDLDDASLQEAYDMARKEALRLKGEKDAHGAGAAAKRAMAAKALIDERKTQRPSAIPEEADVPKEEAAIVLVGDDDDGWTEHTVAADAMADIPAAHLHDDEEWEHDDLIDKARDAEKEEELKAKALELQKESEEVAAAEAERLNRAPPSKEIVVRLTLLDGTSKKVRINEYTTGDEFRALVASKIGLTDVGHFGVCLGGGGGAVSTTAYKSRRRISDAAKMQAAVKGKSSKRKMSLSFGEKKIKNQGALLDNAAAEPESEHTHVETWLVSTIPLVDQNVVEGSHLELRVKFFMRSAMLFSDPIAVHLYYLEILHHVSLGNWPVNETQALRLAAFKMQADYGDFNEERCRPGFFDEQVSLESYLPQYEATKKTKDIEGQIFELYKNHRGQSVIISEVNYAAYCESLPTYGATFFDMKTKGENVLLGITPEGIIVGWDPLVRYADVIDCSVSGCLLSVDTREGQKVLEAKTPDIASGVLDLLSGYRRFEDLGMNGFSSTPLPEKDYRITILTCDEESKVVQYDEKTTAEELANAFADKLELEDRRHFGLCESSADTDRWLDPRRPVAAQFVVEDSKLYYKLRYFFVERSDISAITDPACLNLYYVQFRRAILEGEYVISKGQAVDLAAHHILIDYGTFHGKKHGGGFVTQTGIDKFVPKYLRHACSKSEWEHRIMKRHAQLKDQDLGTHDMTIAAYINLARKIPTYGMTYFSCVDECDKKVLLGVHQRAMVVLEPIHFTRLHYFTYKHIKLSQTSQAIVVNAREKNADGVVHWKQYVYYPDSPFESLAINSLASLYHKIAFMKATGRL